MDEIIRLVRELTTAQEALQRLISERDYLIAARDKLQADYAVLAPKITDAQAAVQAARAALKAAL